MNIYLILTLALLGIAIWLSVSRKKTKKNENQGKDIIYDFENLCEAVRNAVNEVLNEDLSKLRLSRNEITKRRRQQDKLRLSTRQACLGDSGAVEYLKGYIRELLTGKLGISETSICRVISFNESAGMSPHELFVYMYMIYRRIFGLHAFGNMVEDYGLTDPEYDSEGRPIYLVTGDKIRQAYGECSHEGLYIDMLETLTQRCYEVLYGHDVADLLIMDHDIDGVSGGVGGRTRVEFNYLEELGSDRHGKGKTSDSFDVIYCVYRGKLIRMQFMSFGKEQTLERVVKNIYRYNSRATLSKRNPVLNASFKNNSRIVVARPPVSDSWAFYVRKFASTDARRIESLITDRNADKVIDLLKAIVTAECNFVISGNTGGGKTTLLKALIGYVNPSYTLRVIESSFELNINNVYPERNVHVMQERGDFTVYDAIAASKKMDTDVLILGEVNEPKIAGAFIQVAQSGSRMAITTLHHETTPKLIEYLRNALVSEFGISDVRIAQKQVVDSINFDVHMVHDVTGHHFIERITQIIPREEENYEVRDIVVFDKTMGGYRFVNKVAGNLLSDGEVAG